MNISEKLTDDNLILNKILAVAPDLQESFIDTLVERGLMNGKILLAFYNPLLRNEAFFKQKELDCNMFLSKLKY